MKRLLLSCSLAVFAVGVLFWLRTPKTRVGVTRLNSTISSVPAGQMPTHTPHLARHQGAEAPVDSLRLAAPPLEQTNDEKRHDTDPRISHEERQFVEDFNHDVSTLEAHKDKEKMLHSIYSLSRSPLPEAMQYLLDVVSASPDYEMRRQFILCASASPISSVTDRLLELLRDDQSPDVRETTSYALARREPDNEGITLSLLSALDSEDSARVKEGLVTSIGYRKHESAYLRLLSVLTSEHDPALRIKSAAALGFQKVTPQRDTAIADIGVIVEHETDQDVAHSLKQTLLQLNGTVLHE